MRKLFLLALILCLVLTFGVSKCLAEPHIYVANWMIVGTVTDDPVTPSGNVNGRNVVFYQMYPETVGAASGAYVPGKYTVNIYNNGNIPIDSTADYYMAIENDNPADPANGYGTDPVLVNINDEGYLVVDLELKKGAGPIPLEIDEGPVMLELARDGDSVGDGLTATWAVNPDYIPPFGPNNPIDVYKLEGDGSGQFDSTTGWTQVINNNSPTDPIVTNVDVGNKRFQISNQVGNDPKEIYFKALIAGTPTSDPNHGLGETAAVGKFNAVVAKPPAGKDYAYSFVSVPFLVSNPSAQSVFGDQLSSAGSKAEATELWGWTGTTFGNQMYLSDSTGWETVPGFSAVSATPGFGFVFKTKSASAQNDSTLSMVGKVINVGFGPITIASNTYTFLANPYPATMGLKAAGLSAADGVKAGAGSGLADQFWGWTGDTFGEQAYYNTTADDWQAIAGFSLVSDLGPARTFVYKRNPDAPAGGFNWSVGP
ncbi:MAG: hypothetical protein U9R38_06850 [Candidatus Margulisiibacteriota bacterium]|nr:hypothetical protein [Candidatus Margulisiibacteriota bacterium]